jgi:predicted HTH domain antitoxin
VEKSKRDLIQYRANAILENEKVQKELKQQQDLIQSLQIAIDKYEEERKSLRKLVSLSVQKLMGKLSRREDGGNRSYKLQRRNHTQVDELKEYEKNVTNDTTIMPKQKKRFLPVFGFAWRVGGNSTRKDTHQLPPDNNK